MTQNINGVPILVNASEVHKSQEIISLLKHTHNLNVHVQSKFEGAGFLLSSRYSIDSILIVSTYNAPSLVDPSWLYLVHIRGDSTRWFRQGTMSLR